MTLPRVLAALILAVASLAQTQARRPNILFIMADDHGYQAIGAYGHGLNRTPELDRLAREGMLFRNALVTNSLCAPARAVILTGKYSHMNGVLDNGTVFDGSQTTFPKLLQRAGYQTALFGKWHLRSTPQGFDDWEILPGQGNYYNPDFLVPGGTVRRLGYVTDLTTDGALTWLRDKRDKSKPFLLMVHHKASHRNWMPAPRYMELYQGVTFAEPPTLFDDYATRASPAHRQRMEIGRDMVETSDLKLLPLLAAEARGQRLPAEMARMTEGQKRVWDAVYTPRDEQFRRANPTGADLVRAKYQIFLHEYLRTVAAARCICN